MTTITKAAQDAQYKQTIGSTNCMQCAVAYILGLPVCDVPDFSARSSALMAWEEFDAFILSRGFSSVILPPGFSPESDYLASGSTMRGTKHIVVMNDGRLVFDPHPSNDGLVSIDCIRLIAKNHLRAALQDKAGEVRGYEPAGFLLHWPVPGGGRDTLWSRDGAAGHAIGCPVTEIFKATDRAAQPAPVVPPSLKDHQIAAMVSKLRDIAREFHDHDSLRDRIANEIVPALKAAPVVPDGCAIVPVEPTVGMLIAGMEHRISQERPTHEHAVWAAMLDASQKKGGQHG